MSSLLNKTSRYYIIFSLLIFMAGGIVFFFEVRKIFDYDLSESLYSEKRHIELELTRSGSAAVANLSYGNNIVIKEAKEKVAINETLMDTLWYEKTEGETFPVRQLRFGLNCVKGSYVITIRKSMLESEDLVEAISNVLIILFLVFIVCMFFINRWMNKKLWKPFNETLQKLQEFELSHNSPLVFAKTKTKEFDQLNIALEHLSTKVINDYNSIKEFTENASHEIQTPLAVIINKLENLIQTEGLNEQHFSAIQAVYESAIRLSKLNNSLLLLTKIDNSHYIQKETVDLKTVIEKYLNVYEDVINEKGIKLTLSLDEAVKIQINPFLAETLISNLVGNAIKHNIKDGEIKITLGQKELNIINTGNFNTLDTSTLFKRFKKGDPASESLGLGLSIIKKIAGNNNMSIDYKIEENRHIIRLQF